MKSSEVSQNLKTRQYGHLLDQDVPQSAKFNISKISLLSKKGSPHSWGETLNISLHQMFPVLLKNEKKHNKKLPSIESYSNLEIKINSINFIHCNIQVISFPRRECIYSIFFRFFSNFGLKILRFYFITAAVSATLIFFFLKFDGFYFDFYHFFEFFVVIVQTHRNESYMSMQRNDS